MAQERKAHSTAAEGQGPSIVHMRRAMMVLGAMVFIVSLGYGAGQPLIQPYLLRYLGAVPASTVAWHVGLLGGSYLFALFLFAPLWGRLSDRHGRVPVLVTGFAAFLVGGAGMALAPNLGAVYAARLLAGAGAAAIMPTAQAYVADISTTIDRSRRFVLLGSAAFAGFLSGPAFGTWLAGPSMGMAVGQMDSMLNWPALAVALAGVPLLLLTPWCLGRNSVLARSVMLAAEPSRKRFVRASMQLALLTSFAVGTFEVGFNLLGTETLGLTTATMAAMFITCSLAMLVAQSTLLLSSVRSRIDHHWVAAAFAGSALALVFTSWVPGAWSLGLMIAVVATGTGMVAPVLSYELLERQSEAPGKLLGSQAAAGNLGLALGSMSAGYLFALTPMLPFWTAALVLLVGAALSLAWWGPARMGEIAAGKARSAQADFQPTLKGLL